MSETGTGYSVLLAMSEGASLERRKIGVGGNDGKHLRVALWI